jgi:uroporphyrinogen-III synthase
VGASDPQPPVEVGRRLDATTVLVLRARHQASALADRLESAGAKVVAAPALEITTGNTSRLRRAVRDVAAGHYGSVCLTSGNGVAAFADAVRAEGLDARDLAGTQFGVVGPATAARLDELLGIRPDVVGETSTSGALGDAHPPGPGRVLLPRGNLAGRELPRALEAKGWVVDEVVAYRTRAVPRLPAGVLAGVADGSIDVVALTSASMARTFHRLLAGRRLRAAVVSIGPRTSEACADVGLEVAAEADPNDLDGLVAAIIGQVSPAPVRVRPRRSGDPWPSEQTIARVVAYDDARAGQPVPVRHAVGFALGVGALGGAVAVLKPWEWAEEA